MKKNVSFLLILTLISLGKSTLRAQAPAQCQDVMLQAFYWDSYSDSKWTTLNSKASEIAANFNLVWLPPSGNCQSNSSMGYAPVYWFNQNSAFGTQAELKTLIANLKTNGTKAIADVVVNHRSGVSNWTNFPSETYNGVTYSMGPAQICSTDEVRYAAGQATPTGAPDTGDDFDGSRDLDHTSAIVRDNIKGYLQFLKNEMGYSGWRYDMTKGFSASYVNEYNTSAGNYFSVGEYWDGSYDLCKAWVNNCSNNSTTFDFPMKYALNSSIYSGGMNLNNLVWAYNGGFQPAGLIHHPDTKRYAVTFVDNHDTYRDGNASKFSGNVLAAYAFILSSPGIPCVFLSHWNANKGAISAMIAARRAVQLHSESMVTVNQSGANIYVATATGNNGTLLVKIGSGAYNAPSDYTLATSGTDYAIWTKTINAVAPTVTVNPSGGTFYSNPTVSMSTNADASVYYTTNNTAPTNTSTKYSAPLTITTTTTLRAIAYNSTTQLYSKESINTYTISAYKAPVKVRFKVPAGWTACNVYSWDANGTLTAAWPGTSMTLDLDGYYSYTVTGITVLPVGIVFNNGSGVQTVDLSTSTDKCWEAGALSNSKYLANEVICLNTGVKDLTQNSLGIYPNPSQGQFTIETKQKGQLTVYNLQGKMLLQKNLEKTTENVDLSGFGKGIYMLRIEGKEGMSFRKVIIE